MLTLQTIDQQRTSLLTLLTASCTLKLKSLGAIWRHRRIGMCGIAGTINVFDEGTIALAIANKIGHRGPDDGPRLVSVDSISTCAVRLSIVDIEHGIQPMTDETGNVVTHNGEIYNYLELRLDLVKKGYKFKTDCDTEVLLAGFSIFGPEFINKLDGIFAISFYDKSSKILYLFRDYFGVKPLYYYQYDNSLEYSSEIKGFWRDNRAFEIDLDYVIFNQVFNWSNPKQSLYRGIVPVQPGSYLEIDRNINIRQVEYTPDIKMHKPKDFLEATLQTRENLTRAVKSQIPDEVEWGILLSGGVDSSILAWLAKNIDSGLKTFSICSEEIDSEDIINAREVAKFLDTNHTEIRVDFEEASGNYADYLYSIEDINPRFYFYYLIAKHLSDKVKVALCGEGADELYMGYPVYRNLAQFLREASERWSNIKKYAGPIKNEVENILSLLASKNEEVLYDLMLRSQLPWFQLNPVDKCSMRFGVEFRVPYLSIGHALPAIKYAMKDQLSGNIEKNILRAAFKDSELPTLSRSKYFAGTRTLPSFYRNLDNLAQGEYARMRSLYPREAEILDAKNLYVLALLDSEMKKSSRDAVNSSALKRKIKNYAGINR